MPRGETLSPREGAERKKESNLDRLWRSYKFSGVAPKEGTPAANHLFDVCSEYVNMVLKNKGYSDIRRRELHNQIAIMVVGEVRSSMATKTAEHIADFASELVQGFRFDEAEKYAPVDMEE